MREKARESFGKKAKFYATSQYHTEEESLKALLDLADVRLGQSVLDVATGAGHTAAALTRAGAGVTALDITPEMLQEAVRLYPDMGIQWVLGDVNCLPFIDGAFDLVVSRRAPHHFMDIERALSNVTSALRHGSSLVIDDRSVPEDQFADATMNLLDELHDRSHVRDHPLSEWLTMLGSQGLLVTHAERYVRKRPLESLISTAREEDSQEIREVLESLDEEGRRRMGIEEIGGEVYVTHWFVLLKATRP